MKTDIEKVGIISSYLAENISNLYVTKLLKLFYYIDFISYNQRKVSITNDTYYKLPYGPVPSLIKNEIDNLENSLLEKEVVSQLSKSIILRKDTDNFGKIVINNDKNYNLKKLSKYELNLLNELISTYKHTTAKRLSNKTHKEKPYLLSSENSVIDYELAKYLDIKEILPKLA
jgi:uncharacterized phage-associated protein